MQNIKHIKTGLPAELIAQEVNDALRGSGIVVITAPPGAGKSTVLPLTVLSGYVDETGKGPSTRILMLEPRRIAARSVAERMAQLLGEPCGKTVGYRIRKESKVSKDTRIEVVTEGILTKMIISDPTLNGVEAIIFDEFHERSIFCDEALALARETRNILRPDLKLIIMSATIDAQSICEQLGAAKVECSGRTFPVQVIYSKDDCRADNCAQAVARAISIALREQEGDILAFLPGEGEIRRCGELLHGAIDNAVDICPLYGMMPFAQQRRAILPGPRRRVVLATPVAETSLTIEGVRVVVDSGLRRTPVFKGGLSHLETVRVSADMAEQRAGRAGRLCPGVCYRLWTSTLNNRLEAGRRPEILSADLTTLVLDVAAWGASDVSALPWITAPPRERVLEASGALRELEAIDIKGVITAHGRDLSRMPYHPRLSQMLCKAEALGLKDLALDVASLLEDKDPRPSAGVDISAHLSGADPYDIGTLVASAFPSQIAKLRPEGGGHFVMAGGEYVCMDASEALSAAPWIAVAAVNYAPGREGRIFLAAPLSDLTPYMRERVRVGWSSKEERVIAAREKYVGSILVESVACAAERAEIVSAICSAAVKDGLSMLSFNDDVANLQRRVACAACWHPSLELPDLSTAAVLESAPSWLPLYIGDATTAAALRKIDLCSALWAMLTYPQQQAVERIAPSHVTVPTGSKIRLEYRSVTEAPVLRVRLQECFGLLSTPLVDEGKRPVLMELLSPGFKPVQLTTDLSSFWSTTYFEVRSELRRRYPRHSWPDNPLEAPAVRGVRR